MLLPGPEAQQFATYIGWLMRRTRGGIFALNLPFPLIVLLAALIGHFGGSHGAAGQSYGAALIDDGTPTPAHALFLRSRLAGVLLTGLGLWLAAMAIVLAGNGVEGTLTQMGRLFTKAPC